MVTDSHPLIAREGWVHVCLALLLAVALSAWHPLAGIPGWVAVLFVVQFFRDPHRAIPQDEGAVVSPADGRVIVVEPVQDPYQDRKALKISVFMNVFNVHSNRAPVTGEITEELYKKGKFFNAALAKASQENEANMLTIANERGDVTFVQIAGLIARRVMCYAHKGDKLERGQRYGFIRFGSRVDIYLPADSEPCVALGDIVSGGSDIIARMPDA